MSKPKKARLEPEEEYDSDCIIIEEDESPSCDRKLPQIRRADLEVPGHLVGEGLGVEYCGRKEVLDMIGYANKRYPEECDRLSGSIWNHLGSHGQKRGMFNMKMEIRDILFNELSKLFPKKDIRLFAMGSTMNGCGAFSSDLDFCLVLPGLSSLDPKKLCVKKGDVKDELHRIRKATRRSRELRSLVDKTQVIMARVSIIKLELRSPYKAISVDININSVGGVYNTHLLHYYSKCDPRFRALGLIIKNWAISKDICQAVNGTLNCYSWLLLLVHFLQCGVQPPILPNLQALFPNVFSRAVLLDDLCLFRDLTGMPEMAPNNMSVGDLLMGFFHYYAYFPFGGWAISIREGRRVSRENRFQGRPIYIEDPFDTDANTARSVMDLGEIRKCLVEASNIFATRAPCLMDIFPEGA